MFPARVLPILTVAWSLVAQTPAPLESKRLTLQDAIVTSLQNNLQVQIAKETRTSTVAGVLIAEGSFDWNLNSSYAWATQDSNSFKASIPGAAPSRIDQTSWSRSFTAGVTKPFDWGGTFSMSYNPNYSYVAGRVVGGLVDTGGNVIGDRNYNTLAPYTGTFSATYSQSLLKGFGREVTGATLIVARLGAKSADFVFQRSIIDLVATTESAYWDVVFGDRNLVNKKLALDLAKKQLKENQIRVEVGTLAPIEVTSAEAAVAQAEQNIIVAEAQLLNAKDTLIRTLFPNAQRPASLETIDTPTLAHINLKEEEAVKMALDRRVELKSARLDLESRQVLEKAAVNRTMPQLDAYATYAGVSDNYTGAGSVNGDIFSAKSPGYTLGLQFAFPLLNRTARGNLAQARAGRRNSELTLRDQELGIKLEVVTAKRNVEALELAVKATEKTRYFREKDLEAEQKKFDNGMSTNFLVLSKQSDLDTARSNEVQAQITYAKAVTALEKAVGNLMEARNLKVE